METLKFKTINADPTEIANAIVKMIRDVLDEEATIVSSKNVESTVQVNVLIKDRFLIFLSNLNKLIGVQFLDYNKYKNNGVEIAFVMLQKEADKLLEKYGE